MRQVIGFAIFENPMINLIIMKFWRIVFTLIIFSQDNDIDELLQDFESKCNRQILHTVVFYWTSSDFVKKKLKTLNLSD